MAADYNCSGKPNTKPVWTAAPVLVRKVTNGAYYVSGDATQNISVVHLYGSAYELGYAHGSLLKDDIQVMYKNFFAYLDGEIESAVPWLPKKIREILETKGVDGVLDYVYNLTLPYTVPHFIEELHGLADGAGLPYETVARVHMFPELIRAACSMLGAWGPATSSSLNGGLIQLRALDWGTDNPMRLAPALLVYHPTDGNAFAILSWKGFVGALTGTSHHMGISEKKWYTDAPLEVLPQGVPWHYLLRDILQFDLSLESALSRIIQARKTAAIFVGVGSLTDGQFRAVEYGTNTATVFNDSTPFPGFAPTPAAHPMMRGVVYIDKYLQPSDHPCMAQVLQAHYGAIDGPALIELVSRLGTGDIHLAIYDFANSAMYASVASIQTPVLNAYENRFFKFDTAALFSQTL